MAEHIKNCGNCAYSTIEYNPLDANKTSPDDTFVAKLTCHGFVEDGTRPFTVQEKAGWHCRAWYAKQLLAKQPEYCEGCGFPHCPTCNADLDLQCDRCGESPIVDGNYYNFCPYCGQKLDWEVSVNG